MEPLKVILVEDHLLVRNGIKQIFESDSRFKIIAEFDRGEDLIQQIEKLQPDIIFMDISLSGMNGMQTYAEIKKKNIAVRVIMVSMYTDMQYIQQCLDLDVDGYIVKGASILDFKQAMDAVCENKKFFSEEIHQVLMKRVEKRQKTKKEEIIISLTPREVDILCALSQGMTNSVIADKFFISERTVQAHRANIMKKVGAKTSADLIAKAFRIGLLKG